MENICPACQHENKSHYNFCIKCGKQLKENPVILDYKSGVTLEERVTELEKKVAELEKAVQPEYKMAEKIRDEICFIESIEKSIMKFVPEDSEKRRFALSRLQGRRCSLQSSLQRLEESLE